MVEECFVCGVPGNRKRLLEAVSVKGKGIVKICENCSEKEGIPIVRRPTTFQLKESEKKERVYKRPENDHLRKKPEVFKFQKSDSSDVELKDIVDKNYKNKSMEDKKKSPELVDNFHWVIMRARRARGISQEKMAKEISESVAAIKMAERGILPEDGHILIKKIESFLGITLVEGKKDKHKQWNRIESEQPARVIKFDPVTMKNLTIDDLRKMKQMKESSEILEEEKQ